VANILARPLIELAPCLAQCAEHGARIALSGVLASQADEVLGAYAAQFEMAVTGREDDWVLLSGVRQ
jgi:ribosomal protein L11 methyltransferase